MLCTSRSACASRSRTSSPTAWAAVARAAQQLPAGTSVLTLGLGIAPYDPEGSDFIRTKVYVQSGPQLGCTGWIAVGFTGLPDPNGTPASTAERACRCRILEFR